MSLIWLEKQTENQNAGTEIINPNFDKMASTHFRIICGNKVFAVCSCRPCFSLPSSSVFDPSWTILGNLYGCDLLLHPRTNHVCGIFSDFSLRELSLKQDASGTDYTLRLTVFMNESLDLRNGRSLVVMSCEYRLLATFKTTCYVLPIHVQNILYTGTADITRTQHKSDYTMA